MATEQVNDGSADGYGWFAAWVDQHLVLALTFASGIDTDTMFRAFGADPSAIEPKTFAQAAETQPGRAPAPPRTLSARQRHLLRTSGTDPDEFLSKRPAAIAGYVRVGTRGPWTYAIEATTAHGPDLLPTLTAGGRAVSVCFTPKIDTFGYAESGELVDVFDLTLPGHPHAGSDPHRFDTQIAAAGLHHQPADTRGASAALLHVAFGIDLDVDLLEAQLPAAPIPPP